MKKLLIAVVCLTVSLCFLKFDSKPDTYQLETNFRQIVIDPPPLKVSEQWAVSAKDFLNIGGGEVNWFDGKAILRAAKTAEIELGKKDIIFEGEKKQLVVEPILVNKQLYVPLSLATKVMGMSGDINRGNDNPNLSLLIKNIGNNIRYRYHPVYDLIASYNPSDGNIKGQLFLAYQNPYLESLKEICFNLPANAPYGNGAKTIVKTVKVNNRPVAFNSKGSSLLVDLLNPLAPGETVLINISFNTTVPKKVTRLGRSNKTSTIAGWYPILAPRTDNVWEKVAGTTFGEPYFSEAAYYQVTLILPSEYRVLASSKNTGCQIKGDHTNWKFNSEYPIREFAFTVSSEWNLFSKQVGSVQLVLASSGDCDQFIMKVAEEALNFYQDSFGIYPYSYLNMALVPMETLAGMEYPGLILLNNALNIDNGLLAHEISHQWWYNQVGNNSWCQPWIDEALAEYSALVFFRNCYPHDYKNKLANIKKRGKKTELPINLPLERYQDEQTYHQAVYSRGAMLWLKLEEIMGQECLLKALKYIQQYYRYEIISDKALINVLTYYGDLDIKDFEPYLAFEQQDF
ncbi:MAG: hypothetical protein PWP31_423 [Clostridia bacterium]|nr:hypothetical protein [Clostridia bacterium]